MGLGRNVADAGKEVRTRGDRWLSENSQGWWTCRAQVSWLEPKLGILMILATCLACRKVMRELVSFTTSSWPWPQGRANNLFRPPSSGNLFQVWGLQPIPCGIPRGTSFRKGQGHYGPGLCCHSRPSNNLFKGRMTHLFNSFNKHLFSTYYMSDTILVAWDLSVKKTDKDHWGEGNYIPEGDRHIKHEK